MSKGKRDRRQAARELVARQKAAQRRQKRMIVAGAAVGVVILAVGILIAVKLTAPAAKKAATVSTAAASASLVDAVTGVPPSVLDQVGKGSVDTLPRSMSGQPRLKDGDGKPIVFYMGAEYCPFCAAERWPMIVALSRFGSFSNLGTTSSSATDTFPNTPTFTFHGAGYTSQYVDFQPKEIQSDAGVPLETMTADQQSLVKQFDQNGSFPFVDFANQNIISGASYSAGLLAGKTQDQVAAALHDPTTDVAAAILGTANAFTAEICRLTGGQPGNVCTSAAAAAYASTSGQS